MKKDDEGILSVGLREPQMPGERYGCARLSREEVTNGHHCASKREHFLPRELRLGVRA